ncbi:putative UPF0496 protein 5 [Curcuma longa]|uniref:putative UPF0496 protein 5 n=1 Tax=Curcuma longa TaxID=136217 RepID=UPI003D9F3948
MLLQNNDFQQLLESSLSLLFGSASVSTQTSSQDGPSIRRPTVSPVLAGNAAASSSSVGDVDIAAELNSYETACLIDPELRIFDAALQQRTRSASCHSTSCGLRALDFCAILESCLKKASDSQSIAHIALQRFTADDAQEANQACKQEYARTPDELRRFKAAGNPFTEELILPDIVPNTSSAAGNDAAMPNPMGKRIGFESLWFLYCALVSYSAAGGEIEDADQIHVGERRHRARRRGSRKVSDEGN